MNGVHVSELTSVIARDIFNSLLLM